MSIASSLAIAVAERVERSGGARAGLVAWRTLAGNATEDEVRGKALYAALRCALTLRDEVALEELTAAWASVDRGAWSASIASLCKDIARAGWLARATALAEAEARRHPTALSVYTHARCLDVGRDASAPSAFAEAARRAEAEGARDVEVASRVRRASLLARSLVTLPEAVEEARRVRLADASPAARLDVARVLLRSPSRFVRATALGLLDEVVVGEDPALAARALSLAARWVDGAARGALSPLEVDRSIALFGRERVAKAAPHAGAAMTARAEMDLAKDDAAFEAALARAARVQPELARLHARARDILRGRFEVPRAPADEPPIEPSARRVFRQDQVLDVLVAMRDGATARAAHALHRLAEAEEASETLPCEVLTIARMALEVAPAGVAREARAALGDGAFAPPVTDRELREAAVRLFRARLRRPTPGAPPRGFLSLAEIFASLGEGDLAMSARRAALLIGEAGAVEALGVALARSGWELARAGRERRAEAIAKLREAKALLTPVSDGAPRSDGS